MIDITVRLSESLLLYSVSQEVDSPNKDDISKSVTEEWVLWDVDKDMSAKVSTLAEGDLKDLISSTQDNIDLISGWSEYTEDMLTMLVSDYDKSRTWGGSEMSFKDWAKESVGNASKMLESYQSIDLKAYISKLDESLDKK